jgi:hypothetical protein
MTPPHPLPPLIRVSDVGWWNEKKRERSYKNDFVDFKVGNWMSVSTPYLPTIQGFAQGAAAGGRAGRS